MLAAGWFLTLVLVADQPVAKADRAYQTALTAAVQHFAREGDVENLEAILDKHPDLLTAKNPSAAGRPDPTEGYTVFEWAIERGQPEVVRSLIRRGAKVNSTPGKGYLHLESAAMDGHLGVVRVLIEHGARVNVDSGDGWTPLLWAARRGHLDVVRELVENGADLAARTAPIPEMGENMINAPPPDPSEPAKPPRIYPATPARTALQWAEAEQHSDVAEYLRQFGKVQKPAS